MMVCCDKAVFFDFDGTLTMSENPIKTLLKKSGVPGWFFDKAKSIYCGGVLHKVAKTKLVWKIFQKFFKFAGISKCDFDEVIQNTKLLKNTKETIKALKENGYYVFCISGGLRPIIDGALGFDVNLFDEIVACDVTFTPNGKLKKIYPHNYDNEGKAKFIQEMLEKYHIKKENAVFVGNDNNDVYAKNAGVKTFCLNPDNKIVDANNKKIWDGTMSGVDDLSQIYYSLVKLTQLDVYAFKQDYNAKFEETKVKQTESELIL